MPIIEMALAGAIAQGVAGTIRGYKKMLDEDPKQREHWNWGKFGMSIAVGAIIGAGLGWAGFDLTDNGIQMVVELVGANYLLMNGAGAVNKTANAVKEVRI